MKTIFDRFRTVITLAVLGLFILTTGPAQIFSISTASKVSAQNSQHKYNSRVLHFKLNNQPISLSGGKFIGEPADQVANLNSILSSAKKVKAERLSQVASSNSIQNKLQTSLSGYYKVKFAKDIDVDYVVSQLEGLDIIETAYAEAKPAPAPTSSYVSLQNYLQTSPTGVGSTAAKSYAGGDGSNVKIFDLEYSWNTNHEDLTKASSALIPNGTPSDPFNDNNHGTAVLGEMIGTDNTYGVTGAASGSNIKLINVYNPERGYDPVTALSIAASQAAPGDVIIIEQQTWGPTPDTYDFVPIEWIPEVYDAIKALTANGINVIEPAGNGAQNLDDTTYYGSSFPAGKADSGAIIVGAAQNCSGTQLLSRMSFSSYGNRVNVQGPGECVTTTGYGGLFGSNGVDAYYTSTFNGTSSATPVVAAAVADLSSAYKAKNGTYMSTAQIRGSLVQYGAAQNLSAGTLSGHIGPYPNVAKSISALFPTTDTNAPTIPMNLKGSLVSGYPYLTWSASTDNVGVIGYKIYRNGSLYASTSARNFTDKNVVRRTTYKYQVAAYDAAGNVSALSNTVTIKK